MGAAWPRGEPIRPDGLARLEVDGTKESSVMAAMKNNPLAVVTGPPLLGVPISNGSIEGMPKGPLRCAVPNGRSHNVLPLASRSDEYHRRVAACRGCQSAFASLDWPKRHTANRPAGDY